MPRAKLTEVMRIRMSKRFHRKLRRASRLSGREMSDIARPILETGLDALLADLAAPPTKSV